jgi:hypothetical protein
MQQIRNAMAPDTLVAVELNYETARDAFVFCQEKPGKHKPSESGIKVRKELIFWEINPDNLPASVPLEVRVQIPTFLIKS